LADSTTPENSSTSKGYANSLSVGLPVTQQKDPELTAVIDAWPTLPPDVRKMIATVVKATIEACGQCK